MGQPPAISIITPTKNRLNLLCEAMDSVQKQTFSEWEHVVVDDGSDDGTAEEVERRAASDARIRYIRRRDGQGGSNVCRNIGIRESRAELIVFLDSDDLLRPHCIGQRVNIMRRNLDLDFATFATAVFIKVPGDLGNRVENDLYGDDLTRFLCFESPWIITGPIWRKQALYSLGCFDESLPSWQDIDLHIRAIASGCKYLRFSDIDHDIRWQFEPTKVSIEQRRSARHLNAAPELFEKFERTVIAGPGMNWARQRALCSLYFFVAELWLAAGDLRAAFKVWKSVRRRSLASRGLYLSGASLLAVQTIGAPGRRIGGRLTHKWKGWTRMRTNPELVGTR